MNPPHGHHRGFRSINPPEPNNMPHGNPDAAKGYTDPYPHANGYTDPYPPANGYTEPSPHAKGYTDPYSHAKGYNNPSYPHENGGKIPYTQSSAFGSAYHHQNSGYYAGQTNGHRSTPSYASRIGSTFHTRDIYFIL